MPSTGYPTGGLLVQRSRILFSNSSAGSAGHGFAIHEMAGRSATGGLPGFRLPVILLDIDLYLGVTMG